MSCVLALSWYFHTRQGVERNVHEGHRLAPAQSDLGVVAIRWNLTKRPVALRNRFETVFTPPLQAAKMLADLRPADSAQPLKEGRLAAVGVDPLDGMHDRRLRDVAGKIPLTAKPRQGKSEDSLKISIHQLLKGSLVAGQKPIDQTPIRVGSTSRAEPAHTSQRFETGESLELRTINPPNRRMPLPRLRPRPLPGTH